jgi:hypothetical protein
MGAYTWIIAVPVAHVKTETPLVRRVHHAQLAQQEAHAGTTVRPSRPRRDDERPLRPRSEGDRAARPRKFEDPSKPSHRLVALAAHASLMIGQPARVVKMAQPLGHAAQMIVHHAQEAIAIVLHVHAAQMIVRRAQEVLMSARPVVVDLHSVVQQKAVGAQVREEDVRAKVAVVRQRAVVAQAKVVVAQHLVGQQRAAVDHSVMTIVK